MYQEIYEDLYVFLSYFIRCWPITGGVLFAVIITTMHHDHHDCPHIIIAQISYTLSS